MGIKGKNDLNSNYGGLGIDRSSLSLGVTSIENRELRNQIFNAGR